MGVTACLTDTAIPAMGTVLRVTGTVLRATISRSETSRPHLRCHNSVTVIWVGEGGLVPPFLTPLSLSPDCPRAPVQPLQADRGSSWQQNLALPLARRRARCRKCRGRQDAGSDAPSRRASHSRYARRSRACHPWHVRSPSCVCPPDRPSGLTHSCGYGCYSGRPALHPFGARAMHGSHSLPVNGSADRPSCLAGFPGNSDPLMQHAG